MVYLSKGGQAGDGREVHDASLHAGLCCFICNLLGGRNTALMFNHRIRRGSQRNYQIGTLRIIYQALDFSIGIDLIGKAKNSSSLEGSAWNAERRTGFLG